MTRKLGELTQAIANSGGFVVEKRFGHVELTERTLK
jgi:hypothetical protein